ncbi:LamG-like jellyroll fold domain-containing protein [Vibrio hangzhouensis]|uniref:BNR repeat-containing family member n=1 Tax=Vibrio hangzhouensis TaxID=462991 RepID=A0A1H5TS69_9VIBR|nr:LamG-like jellyroll fold domain-containing protein [Vibrio hangzhouensis]SEF65068.1 BNR repeat-containing family member [Vibrio hangzhouensis]
MMESTKPMALLVCSALSVSTAYAAPVSTTTVAHWTMDTPHQSIVEDSVNTFYRAENLSANFLTYGSPPAWSSDTPDSLSGYSLKFNGLSAGLTIPASKKMATSSFSTALWVKPSGVSNQYQAVYSTRGAAQGYVLYITPQGYWEFWLQSPKGWSKVKGAKVVVGQWTHIAVSFDKQSELEDNIYQGSAAIHINGEQIASVDAKYQPDGLSKTGIGYRGSNNQYFFNGLVSQADYYPLALSTYQISSLYSSNIKPDSVMAMWPMNEGEGTKVVEPLSQTPNPEDKLAYNHPGYLYGSPTWETDSKTGQGRSLSFDGYGDGVWVDSNPELNLSSFSVSMLVKPTGELTGYQAGLSSRGEQGGFQVYLTPEKRWQFWLNSGGAWQKVGNALAQTDRWQHVIATYNADELTGENRYLGTASMYLDGHLVEQVSGVPYQPNLESKMGIGYRGSDAQYFFQGNIDKVEVIAGALTQQQVERKTWSRQAHWSFSEVSGELLFDEENNHNGKLETQGQWKKHQRDGTKGRGLLFKRGQGIEVPASEALQALSWSVSGWVSPRRVGGDKQTIWQAGELSSQRVIAIDEQGRWSLQVGNGEPVVGSVVTNQQWTHFVASFQPEKWLGQEQDVVGTATLYVDGVRIAETNNVTMANLDAAPVYIGMSSDVEGQYYSGLMDELSVYAHALDNEQAAELYARSAEMLHQSPWDEGQLEWDTDKWQNDVVPGSAPLKYRDLYQREREMFDYNPRYLANMVTFDSKGREVMVAGAYEAKGDNSTIYPSYGFPTEQFVQVKTRKGWKAYSVNDALRSAWKQPDWDGKVWSGAKLIHERVEFDNDGDAYLLTCVDKPLTGGTVWNLLYSKQGKRQFKEWQAYSLPSRADKCHYQNGHYNFQAATGNINRDVPPVLIYDQSQLVPIEKTGEGLQIGQATSLIRDESGITEYIAGYTHSGGMNSTATIGHMTHFVFARLDSNLGNNTTDTDIYYASYNHLTGEVTLPKYLTTTGSCCLSPDNHNIPFILLDSDGRLHVIAGSHQAPFRYLTAETDSGGELTGEWSDAIDLVSLNGDGDPFNTYPGLVIDGHDTIHMVFRKVDEKDRYSLHYMRKPFGQDWQDMGSLVIPAEGRYSVYYHKLSVGPDNELYLNYWFYHHFLNNEHAKQYRERWPLELIETGGSAEVNLYNGIKAHNGVILRSRDNGDSWSLFGAPLH